VAADLQPGGRVMMALIEEYVALRQTLGFKFHGTARLLREFGAFAGRRGDTHVRYRTAIEWAKEHSSKDAVRRRLASVRRLSNFLRAEDARHEPIPKRHFKPRSTRPMPHIYTSAEISTLLGYAAQIEPPGCFRSQTLVALFGLLAATGLRASEALHLRLRDFSDDGLMIRETKFRKSRFIPLHGTTSAALKRYIASRRAVASVTDHLFISERTGRAPRYAAVWWTFRSICMRAGIGVRTASGRSPRIHDLRHTFAVRSLERCASERLAVTRHMGALATYLGHANAQHTFWYLHRTPQLLRGIARACEQFTGGRAR
jgi:integrase/recombinase XerD